MAITYDGWKASGKSLDQYINDERKAVGKQPMAVPKHLVTGNEADRGTIIDPYKGDTNEDVGRLATAGGQFVRGLGRVAGAVPKAIDRGAAALGRATGTGFTNPEEGAFFQMGESIERAAGSIDVNPEYADEFFTGKVAEGAGNVLGFMAGGAVTGGLKGAAALGSALGTEESAQDYESTVLARGEAPNPTERAKAAGIGALIGTSEALGGPVQRGVMGAVGKAGLGSLGKSRAGRMILEGVQEGIEEASQEAFQTGARNIAAAKLGYDRDRAAMDGLVDSAAEGGAVGAILGAAMAGMGIRTRTSAERARRGAPTEEEAKTAQALEDKMLEEDKAAKPEIPKGPYETPEVATTYARITQLESKYKNLSPAVRKQARSGFIKNLRKIVSNTKSEPEAIVEAAELLTKMLDYETAVEGVKAPSTKGTKVDEVQPDEEVTMEGGAPEPVAEQSTTEGIEVEELTPEELEISMTETPRAQRAQQLGVPYKPLTEPQTFEDAIPTAGEPVVSPEITEEILTTWLADNPDGASLVEAIRESEPMSVSALDFYLSGWERWSKEGDRPGDVALEEGNTGDTTKKTLPPQAEAFFAEMESKWQLANTYEPLSEKEGHVPPQFIKDKETEVEQAIAEEEAEVEPVTPVKGKVKAASKTQRRKKPGSLSELYERITEAQANWESEPTAQKKGLITRWRNKFIKAYAAARGVSTEKATAALDEQMQKGQLQTKEAATTEERVIEPLTPVSGIPSVRVPQLADTANEAAAKDPETGRVKSFELPLEEDALTPDMTAQQQIYTLSQAYFAMEGSLSFGEIRSRILTQLQRRKHVTISYTYREVGDNMKQLAKRAAYARVLNYIGFNINMKSTDADGNTVYSVAKAGPGGKRFGVPPIDVEVKKEIYDQRLADQQRRDEELKAQEERERSSADRDEAYVDRIMQNAQAASYRTARKLGLSREEVSRLFNPKDAVQPHHPAAKGEVLTTIRAHSESEVEEALEKMEEENPNAARDLRTRWENVLAMLGSGRVQQGSYDLVANRLSEIERKILGKPIYAEPAQKTEAEDAFDDMLKGDVEGYWLDDDTSIEDVPLEEYQDYINMLASDPEIDLRLDQEGDKPLLEPVSAAEFVRMQKVAKQFTDSLKGMGLNIQFLGSNVLHWPIRAIEGGYTALKGTSDTLNSLKGLRMGNHIYIMTGRARSAEDLQRTLFHEVIGHYAMDNMFGAKWRGFIEGITSNQRNAVALTKIATDYGLDLTTEEGRFVAGKELVARAAEDGINATVLQKAIGWVRHALRSLGIIQGISNGDIQFYLSRAASQLREGKLLGKDTDEIEAMIDSVEVDEKMRKEAKVIRDNLGNDQVLHDTQSWYSKQVDRIVDRIRGNIFTKYSPYTSLPDEAAFRALRGKALGSKDHWDNVANKFFKAFYRMTKEDQLSVTNYLTNAEGRIKDVPEEYRLGAVAAKQQIRYLGRRLVEQGKLSEEVYNKNKGAYLPNTYLKYVVHDQEVLNRMGTGNKRSLENHLKQRKDLTEDYKKFVLGLIQDPAYVVPHIVSTIGRDVAMLDFLNSLNEQAKINGTDPWVYPDDMLSWRGQPMSLFAMEEHIKDLGNKIPRTEADMATRAKMADTLDEMKALVAQHKEQQGRSGIKESNYRQIPSTQRYGNLAGLKVRKEIYDDLFANIFASAGDGDVGSLEKLLGPGGKVTKWQQIWKSAKTVWNPPTHVRNFASNFGLLDISTNTNAAKLMNMVREEVINGVSDNKGIYWDIALKNGVTETTFTAQETFRAQSKWVRDQRAQARSIHGRDPIFLARKLMDLGEWAGKVYQGTEAVYKVVKIRDYINNYLQDTGRTSLNELDPTERIALEAKAAAEAQKWIFDYSAVPRSIKYARNAPIGAPFLTFSYLALPRVAEGMARHPQKYIKYMMLPYAMQMLVQSMYDIGDDEYEDLLNSMPQHVEQKIGVTPIPYRDDDGNLYMADFGYFMPWQPWTNFALSANKEWVQDPDLKGAGGPLLDLGILGGPVPDLITAIKGGVDPFTQREISNPYDPKSKQFIDRLQYMYDMVSPSFMGSKYGFLGRMYDYASGETDRKGNPDTTGMEAASRLTGLNLNRIQADEQRRKRLKGLQRELQQAIQRRGKLMKEATSNEERARIISDHASIIRAHQEKLKEYKGRFNE